jgi:hypothetical protein
MNGPLLEEVYKSSGVPTYTFVKPVEYQKLFVSLRTPGRGLVVEGPSGIGKTTSIYKALEELGQLEKVLKLTARKQEDRDLIKELPHLEEIGVVIIDDFHRLPDDVKQSIADYMKTLADEEAISSKIVVVGINKAGDSLVSFARDLNNRVDTITFEANPVERLLELIKKGEQALNISINTALEIASDAHGSFHIAQMLCHETCLLADITEKSNEHKSLTISFEVVRNRVLGEMRRVFYEPARKFATGPRLRREGRAPYFHILNWLAMGLEWSLQLDRAMTQHPNHKGSVGQVVDKGYLTDFLKLHREFDDVLHYDPYTRVLSVEDPKFVYFIRNMDWHEFARNVGYLNIAIETNYDFAISFAGADRQLAQLIFDRLTEEEIEVFYDKNEQHRILAENVEEYLGPIYSSGAQFVLVLLGPEYPKKIWTKFESDRFKDRFCQGSVIPIWFSSCPPGIFDESSKVGGFTFEPGKDVELQINYICGSLIKKLKESRLKEPVSW